MADRTHVLLRDGFSKVKPILEGPIVKGGLNGPTRITTRPPPPAPMNRSSTTAGTGTAGTGTASTGTTPAKPQ